MKVANLVSERFKESPSECVIDSHVLMIRGGYMKYVANGIYTQQPQLRRITRKIEQILREEMDAVGGQELLFPVALPASLWEASGRYDSVGRELLRFEDRNGAAMVLGMTHEEAAVQAMREYGGSYQRYPFMVYQIQTKFRDEARPRGGLIRVREFTMKDAYSFHTAQADLDACYARCHAAYLRIFARAGLDVVSVASDAGMMGGKVSHEFMYLTPAGEDSIALCGHCDYRANVEAAANIIAAPPQEAEAALVRIPTPGIKTIDDLCAFLHTVPERTCKAVAYTKASDGGTVVLFLRGDMEANETKVRNFLGDEITPAALEAGGPLAAGFIGPYRLSAEGLTVLYDRSLEGAQNLACGGNIPDTHYTGLCLARDCGPLAYGDFGKVRDGGICPACGRPALRIARGIEVGNIFQLGDAYTRALDMAYQDADGSLRYPLMGCYGIGVGRLAAAVCEAHHDENGPIWPAAIAPWQVQLCCLRADQEAVRQTADALYEALMQAGVEVLYDERVVSAGIMFSDADLFGCPVRVIVSPRNLKAGQVELASRDKAHHAVAGLEAVMPAVRRALEGAW